MVKSDSPAMIVARKFGGVSKVARICGVHRSQPGRWGGTIPARHHRRLLDAARAENIPLTADDLVGEGREPADA